jgi:hypothetical protein
LTFALPLALSFALSFALTGLLAFALTGLLGGCGVLAEARRCFQSLADRDVGYFLLTGDGRGALTRGALRLGELPRGLL